MSGSASFKKKERITHEKEIEELFLPCNKSLLAFPLRALFTQAPSTENALPHTSILVSVPKKRLHHAIDRNRVKRQIREAYRLNKSLLPAQKNRQLHIGFVYIDSALHPTAKIVASMRQILKKIAQSTE